MFEDDIVEDIFVMPNNPMLVSTNLLDDCIVNVLEDVVILEPNALIIGVVVTTAVMVLALLLGIVVVDRIMLLGVTVFMENPEILGLLTGEVVTVKPLIEIELGALGNVSLLDMHSSIESLHFPLVRLKVHNVTCLLFLCPPNINPYLLTLASELHSKLLNLKKQ